MRRALLPAWTALTAVALVLGAVAPASAAQRGERPGTSPDRPGSRSAGTATATATACRSTAPRGPRGRADLPPDRGVLLPRHRLGRPPADASPSSSPATPPTDLVVRARPGLTPARHRPSRTARRCPPTARPAGGSSPGRAASAGSYYLTDRWRPWAALKGRGEFYAGGAPITLVTPSGDRAYRGRLRTAITTSGTRVTVNDVTLENYLRGVVPLEIPASVEPRRRPGAGGRGPHLRGVRAGAPALLGLPALRHRVVPGLRRVRRRAPRRRPGDRGHRAQILTSGGEPAFTQFASSSGGWTSAGSVPYLTAREDPYDDWSGNPVHDWSARARRHHPRARLAGDRRPDADRGDLARRQRCLGWPGPVDHPGRDQGPGGRQRRQLPLRARAALDLADVQRREALRTGRSSGPQHQPASSAQNAAPTPRIDDARRGDQEAHDGRLAAVLVGERAGQRRGEGAEQGQTGGGLHHVAGRGGDQGGQGGARERQDQVASPTRRRSRSSAGSGRARPSARRSWRR